VVGEANTQIHLYYAREGRPGYVETHEKKKSSKLRFRSQLSF